MNKIKVIDLLNMISKGEEVPNRVRFDNVIWNKVYGEKNIFYENEYDDDLFIYFFRKNLDFTLNDEVEILEEENKIPEKLNLDNDELRGKETPRAIDYLIESKINQVIDYLKSKGDE